ncbi:MAG: cation:proton antiporter [Armatimonadota bacterium]
MPFFQLNDIFDQTVALLLLAAVIGAVALKLRQPLIVGFIAAGILAGPSVFGIVRTANQVHFLAELGLALLLFVVGLRLDVGLIRKMGKVAVATGLGQVIFTAIIGFVITLALGIQVVPAIYIAVALTFSSTIIIVKMLSDKRETDSLHGRIAVGLLIVQDIIVLFVMIALTAFSGGQSQDIDLQILLIIAKGAALIAGLGLLMYLVLPRLLAVLARSSELLVLFSIAWAVGLASLSESLGFSLEIGAFLAGVSIASTNYREIVGAKLVSLRDFLLLFFFIDIGSGLDLRLLGHQVWAAIPLSIFVLVGNPLIMMVIMGFMGYRKRTSFLSGVFIAQISEFSLILAALGLKLGHIGPDTVGLITLVGLITIGLSTYMILYSNLLYEKMSPYLKIFERQVPHREQAVDAAEDETRQAEVILFGLGRYGGSIGSHLVENGRTILGVDFDPRAVESWNNGGQTAVFGDAEDPEFPASLPLSTARWVISSVRERTINKALIHALEQHGYRGSIAVTAHTVEEAEDLKSAGADVAFIPFLDASSQAVDIIMAVDEEERRKKMDNAIAKMSNHYIICGYGRMGQQIAGDLRHNDVEFVVIERNPAQLPKLKEQNIPYVEGNATEDRVLLDAGIERASGLISVAATDEENVFIVLTARGLNQDLFIVARSILEENEDKLRKAGANRVMSPYVLGGRRMAASILKPRVMDFLDIALHAGGIDIEIGDIVVPESAPFANKTIRDSGLRKSAGVIVLAVKRRDGRIYGNPDADLVIEPGDDLIIMGTSEQLAAAEKMLSG